MRLDGIVGVPLYVLLAYAAVAVLVTTAILTQSSLFAAVRWLTFEKTPLLILANAGVATVLVLLQRVLGLTVGQLRDLEVEQLIDHGKSTLLDTVLFLILASPTVDGGDVPHSVLLTCLGGIICLKLYHHIAQIRVAHMLEAGLVDDGVLSRMTCLLLLLLAADAILNVLCFRRASSSSSFYIWILFEALGLTLNAATGLGKLSVLFVDFSLEARLEDGHGWPLKNEYIFTLDVFHDVGSLGCFLTFLLVFLFTHPARLPIYLASDVAQTARQLVWKIRSFRRYRKIASRLEIDFPNASLEELEAADTCIICRDLLTIGAKRLICGHVLHFDCLKGWFVQHQSCPTCRMDIPVKEASTPREAPREPAVPNPATCAAIPAYEGEREVKSPSILRGTGDQQLEADCEVSESAEFAATARLIQESAVRSTLISRLVEDVLDMRGGS